MKQRINFMIAVIVSAFIFLLSSCKKDEGKLPDISFKTDAGYTSANATVARNTAFKVGINAAKTESNDILKTFNISVSFDGGASSTVYSESLTAAQGDNYTYEFRGTTRNHAGMEKYTFTITNRDGLINTVTLTITVP